MKLPDNWKIKRLDEIADFQNGHSFYRYGYAEEGLLAIDLFNISEDGKLRFSDRDKYVSHEISQKKSKFILSDGDLVIAMTDMTQKMGILGKCALVKHNDRYILNQRIGRIVADNSLVLTSYLRFFINSPFFLNPLYSLAKGAVQKYVNTDDIKGNKIYLPPMFIQEKITAILSAYDNLIENNLRRIKILEEMAQNLYREWFVNFRFPGHENTRFVDSPLGKIPQGWEVVSFTEIADVLSGGTPKTTNPEYWGGHILFFAPKDTPSCFYVTETEKTITEFGLNKCNSQLYPPNTVFITARGTVGNVVITACEMAMNQSCYALRGKEGIGQKYLYMLMLNQVDYLKKNTGGATFSTIVVDTFRRMQIVKPSNLIIEEFDGLLSSLFRQMINMINRNSNLRQTRDLLLPKLISGEVDVSELDIKLPEEASI